MKKYFKSAVFLLFIGTMVTACQKDVYSTETQPVPGAFPDNPVHPLRDSLEAIVQKHIARGVPGAQVMVKDNDGWCVVAGGYANIEKQVPMPEHLTGWVYSITKMFTATLVMLEVERGHISLDQSIREYLPAQITDHLDKSARITVRMLLNHSSGLPNFTVSSGYFLTQFNSPLDQPSLEEQLDFIKDEKTLFEPGTDFFYSNTNYLLLQMILEKVTGTSWETLLKNNIIVPYSLLHTHYPVTASMPLELGFPNYYFERNGDGRVENVTQWHNAIGRSLDGYGGIAAHGADIIRFMELLMQEEIVNAASLQEMRQWIQGKQSTEPDYGLGLEYYEYIKGVPTYGHEGDNIGGTTQILYIPSQNRYIFITLNAGRQLYGEYLFRTSDMKIDLCRFVSK